ncbi:uncharacterized protein [Primulina eburnea]|uniref:uncharacterized protein isoform X3 n=2 Tax=Primulina eburnea TaxID=1245227 RepID=UPI003C6C5BB1
MEATSSGEHTPNNNNVTHQQQRSTQNVRSSNSSSYINERRQMLTHNERERIHSMTQQRRQSYLARRRSNYRRRQDNDRSSIPDESNLGNSNFVAPTTMIQQSPHNIDENLVDVTTVRQTCRSEPISFRTLTSNYERGSSSTCLPRPNSVIQGNIFNENNVITNIQRYPRPRRYRNLARNFSESEINYRWKLSDPRICIHCQALLFHGETSQFCCRNGNTNLDAIPSPIELQELYAADNEEGRHFRRLIRAYNHVFSFTSMGVNIDESLTTGTHGIYTFRAQGSIYHSIGSLLPNENCRPRYMQMWIVDTDHDIDNRLHENPELRRELLLKIQNILDQHNPFVHVFRQIGKCQDIHNCRLIIRQQKPNEHQYSLPTTSQVAAVIVDNECAETLSNRDITIQGIGGNLINIQDVVGYYDPLQYPLLLPYGTYGWDLNSRNINGTRLTCLNYYAYMLQIRENSPSLILRGGRLLQQYVVDNYVKIETQRLRWIRSNQRDICSELYQGLQDCLHGGENHAGFQRRKKLTMMVIHNIFVPDDWSFTFFEGLNRHPDSILKYKTVTELGSGNGWISIAIAGKWSHLKVFDLVNSCRKFLPLNLFHKFLNPNPDAMSKMITENASDGFLHSLSNYCALQGFPSSVTPDYAPFQL